ncbi:MAG TPA: chloride channel protein [Mariprofundaceae bacterium]|nr:chloride channel protein [Mariprofundaceae bacterium]
MRWLMRLQHTTRLIILSVILGVVGALGAQVFIWLLHLTQVWLLAGISGYQFIDVAGAHRMGAAPDVHLWYWLIPVATTLGGLISGILVYTLAPEAEGHGTDAAVKGYHRTSGRIRYRIPVIKTIASAITIGSGGSAGREGPTAQIAAGVGSFIGGVLNLPDEERRILLLVGMAAGLSAVFKSPLGTALFAVEILYSTMAFEGRYLTYTLVASAVSYAITGLFDGWSPLFVLPHDVSFGAPVDLIWFVVLAALAGGLGALLPAAFYWTRDAFQALKIPNVLKPALGGLGMGLLGLMVPPLLGGGYGYIQFALQGGSGIAIWVLLLLSVGKIVALSLTVGSGGSGGVFAPSLYVGAMLGAAFAMILHTMNITGIPTTALAVVGMAALFAGAARVPIASLVMVAEMTGGYHLIMPTMLAVSVSYLVQMALTRNAKYPTLYEAQELTPVESPANTEMFSKIIADFLRQHRVQLDGGTINRHLTIALANGEGIPLSRGHEQLYCVELEPGSDAAGQEVRQVACDDVVIVGVLRGESEIVPGAGTVLQIGDELLIAATPASLEQFRQRIAPPEMAGDEAIEEWEKWEESQATP